jgi:SAM-dependent methyltransferase
MGAGVHGGLFKIDRFLTATPKELESLSWYEVVSALGLLSFNSQGYGPIGKVADLARITEASTVLMAGCGAGGTAVHLAELTGATVHGIDISPESINTACRLALDSPARGKIHFQIGDAHALPFAPGTFDVVITEYMAFFLRQDAFEQFHAALRPGGTLALAELMKDPAVREKADSKILAAEAMYSDLLGYRFHIPLTTEYIDRLTRAGFDDVRMETRFAEPSFGQKIKAVGGWNDVFKITRATLRLMSASPLLRREFLQMGRVKRVIVQSRPTARFLFQALVTGRKPMRMTWPSVNTRGAEWERGHVMAPADRDV